MAAGLLEPLVAFWKEWGILALVLMSFSLQVILLITAEFRRRKDSGVLKVVVWSAYLLADTTAIYALGHMSVTSPMSQEQQVMAFWAPFLLLHLGGQDNITAYSIEDNRLWLRHLQSFVVQVLAAAYVLYQSSIVARRILLRPAAILMFVVGVVKYGERVCALKLACSGHGKNYQSFLTVNNRLRHGLPFARYDQIYEAHTLLDFAKNLLKGPLPYLPGYKTTYFHWDGMYGVAEVQLSLMHDVLYSKAELIHTWHGYCIRVFSLPATVAALLLFSRFGEKDGYRRADVATTYVLLAGAVVLEIISVLRAVSSSWTYGKRIKKSHSAAIRVSTYLSCIFKFLDLARYARCWCGSLGQHNLIYMCSHCKDSRGSKIARWMGLEDWWNMLVYTSSVPVSPHITPLLKKQMKASDDIDKESPDHIRNSRGRAALKRRPGLYKELRWSVDTELDETILVWHIATHVYLSSDEAKHARPYTHQLAQVTQELSNYIMFLLAARPYMLPGNASRQRYVGLCHRVIHGHGYEEVLQYRSEEDLLRLIRDRGSGPEDNRRQGGDKLSRQKERDDRLVTKRDDRLEINATFDKACRLGAKLISKERETPDANMLELISQVWVDLLCYAAYWCKPDSHARQLSNGGEFTTVVALMLEYMGNDLLRFPREGERLQDMSADSMADSTTAPGNEDV